MYGAGHAFWNPAHPESWDWGAGYFTRLAVEALQGTQVHYIGVDPNPDAHAISAAVVAGLQGNRQFHLKEAGQFLHEWVGVADLIYFDHGDCAEESAQMHARDAATIIRRGLLPPGGLVLLDDHLAAAGSVPKTHYTLPLFRAAGYRALVEGYQVLLKAPDR